MIADKITEDITTEGQFVSYDKVKSRPQATLILMAYEPELGVKSVEKTKFKLDRATQRGPKRYLFSGSAYLELRFITNPLGLTRFPHDDFGRAPRH